MKSKTSKHNRQTSIGYDLKQRKLEKSRFYLQQTFPNSEQSLKGTHADN